jgi:hypothetical protein
MPRALSIALACAFVGCTSLAGDLLRAEKAFSDARYEEAQLWLDDLSNDVARMRPTERARYYYLAGMSAHRTGRPVQARHALALCREELRGVPDALPEGWRRQLTFALADLDSPPR